MSAMKDDKQDLKPVRSYLSPILKDEICYGMMAGAIKYEAYNYLKGHKLSQLMDAMERHLDAVRQGEWYDVDTSRRLGRPVTHLGLVGCGLNMIFSQLDLGTLTDDRGEHLLNADFFLATIYKP